MMYDYVKAIECHEETNVEIIRVEMSLAKCGWHQGVCVVSKQKPPPAHMLVWYHTYACYLQ
jgi:hypothetical protein